MLGFLAEGLVVPILAAYLITLVIGLVFLVRQRGRDADHRDPPIGKNSQQ